MWLQKIEIPIPEGWRPIGLGLKLGNHSAIDDGPCWTEAVNAAIQMRDDPNLNTPRTQQQLYEYMLEKKQRFPNCCGNSVQNVQALKMRVWRERGAEMKKDPLKDPQFQKILS